MGLSFRYNHTIKGKESAKMEYSIRYVRGHVEVYDAWGDFCFSADDEREARAELAAMAA